MEDAEYEIMYRVEETHWWYRALHRLLLQRLTTHLPGWQNKPLLDAGCGTGAVLECLGRSPQHVGVDLSEKAVAFCRQRGLPRILACDINALPFAAGSFDAVICSSVLYHRWIPDVEATLRELYRVLKPGGLLLLNVPAFPALHSAHDEKVFTARRFLSSEVTASLAKCDYEILECAYWTSLVFPLVWAARRFRLLPEGRDFEATEGIFSRLVNRSMALVMTLELTLMQRVRFPAGVSIYAVAKKAQ